MKVTSPNFPDQLPGEGMCLWSLSGFFTVVGDNIWFGTSRGRIFRSTDKGFTWDAVTVGFPSPNFVTSVTFRDSQTGLALTANPLRIAKTVDGGSTWTLLPLSFPSNFWGRQVEYIPGTQRTWLIPTTSTKYIVSYNDGETWDVHDSNVDVNAARFLDRKTGFAGSYSNNPALATLFKWSGTPFGNRLFVNDDATGTNDGTSWANAYTDLQSALATAEEGDQIWVAEGTYKPAAPGGSQNATFLIDKNLKLYGGFAGTESTLAERGDPADYPTVLSGDLNGDDVANDFSTNRDDNVHTVVTIEVNITQETQIDGFTIAGGHSDEAGDNFSPLRSGGGIYSTGSPALKHLHFTHNYAAWRGAGAYFLQNANPIIEHSTFTHNKAENFGGGLATDLDATSKPSILHCTFVENQGLRGGGAAIQNSAFVADNCTFISNLSIQQAGGLFHRVNVTASDMDIKLKNSHFEKNQSTIGGGFFIETYGVDLGVVTDNINYHISDCIFKENFCTQLQPGWGIIGGGGYITSGSDNSFLLLENCQFLQNHSDIYVGGFGTWMYGANTEFNLKNSILKENSSVMESGAMEVIGEGLGENLTSIENCLFEGNTTDGNGILKLNAGYLGIPSLFTAVVKNSAFVSNQAANGSGIWVMKDDLEKNIFTIENCQIENNTASNAGGGMFISGKGIEVVVKNTILANNQSSTGGAIANNMDAGQLLNLHIENSLMSQNTSADAAITVSSTPDLNLLNCTVADNQGGGISIANQSSLTLQNTILYNPGHAEFTSSGDATFTSLGGNLIGDLSLDGQLTPLDKQNLDPLFAGPGDYQLTMTSPCVDAGVDDGVTATLDLAGNPRIQGNRVDMGAFESPFSAVSTREVIAGTATLSPNPAGDFVNVTLPADVTGTYQINLYDLQGRHLNTQFLVAGQPLDLSGLSAGMYTIKAIAGDKTYTGRFVKK